ncbi:hypothetical protein CH372_19340 [Leptospira meyeri]|uniref:hypothetical protein n=1 Tax=Leptospira meyeri TaxID=29508 RepID=UPI000C2A1203|nr:hypothetical protein [Leptospira meyeri]PKA10451.1 hypothetical protein CH372_19340 [Leptospira meyeri]PKA23498.1 hypothetical protein CH381_25290 [Leptospira sp. mixed culture ATI2-C-A1]
MRKASKIISKKVLNLMDKWADTDWYRNTKWTDEISEHFEYKLKKSRGSHSKSEYLRIQAQYLLKSSDYGHIGEMLALRLISEYPNETSAVNSIREALGDFYIRLGQSEKAEGHYNFILDYNKTGNLYGTPQIVEIKLAKLILDSNQKDRFVNALEILENYYNESNGRFYLKNQAYLFFKTKALLLSHLKYRNDAISNAKLALEIYEDKDPQFPNHKSVGKIFDSDFDLEQLRNLIEN